MAAAWVTAVAQVQSLAWDLLHAVGTGKKKKKRESGNPTPGPFQLPLYHCMRFHPPSRRQESNWKKTSSILKFKCLVARLMNSH